MKKILSLLLSAALILSITSCTAKNEADVKSSGSDIPAVADTSGESRTETAALSTAAGEEFESLEASDACCDVMVAPGGGNGEQINAVAGTLTAGEWNDNDHWTFWNNLYNAESGWEEYRTSWDYDNVKRYFVTVSSAGKPIENASVSVCDSDGKSFWTAKTDNEGKCYLYVSRSNTAALITASYDGKTSTTEVNNGTAYKIELDEVSNGEKSLDLLLMFDTTGSMSDELVYLQKEFEDVVNKVTAANSNLPTRVSVNFYRDDGDDYLIRDFPFTSDISSAQKDLAAQSADGGGDTPEFVNGALDNAVNEHDWKENSTKIMLFVLDAPPHNEAQVASHMKNLTAQAAAKGIRIIPVVSSGADKETEYLMRDLALKTGGTYVFLTNDSGIGLSHIAPTIGDYTVEKLNELLVRVINSYLSSASLAEEIDVPVVTQTPITTTEMTEEPWIDDIVYPDTASCIYDTNFDGDVLSFVIENLSDTELGYGHAPYLDVWNGEEWQNVEVNPDYAYDALWVILLAGESNEYSINLTNAYGKLPAGQYRYTLIDAFTEFTVE